MPIPLYTLIFSPHSVGVVARTVARTADTLDSKAGGLRAVLDAHLSMSLSAAMMAAMVVSVVRRDRRAVFALFWMIVGVAGPFLLIGPYEAERYAILPGPAYCLCAAALATLERPRGVRRIGWALLATVVLFDASSARRVRPVGAGGYEAAARYVVGRTDSPTVLYSASADSGYFVFFVRKHDDLRRQIVLRSDKMLTTSWMGDLSVETHITTPDDIYTILRRYGTRLVVIEDHATGVPALDWLRSELAGPNFAERHRVPILTRDSLVAGVDLVTYEYLHAAVPDPDASIDIGLPVIGRDIHVRLSDLRE